MHRSIAFRHQRNLVPLVRQTAPVKDHGAGGGEPRDVIHTLRSLIGLDGRSPIRELRDRPDPLLLVACSLEIQQLAETLLQSGDQQ